MGKMKDGCFTEVTIFAPPSVLLLILQTSGSSTKSRKFHET
jgi:hypothetical protein